MLIDEMTSSKASQLIGKIDTVLLPVGTLEAHGPHLSVASDVVIPARVAQEVERLAGDRVFVAPVIPYGHNFHLMHAPGTHDVPSQIFSDYVYHVLRGFAAWKIKYAVILNGHGGNTDALRLAAERASDAGLKTVVLNWWGSGFVERFKGVVQDIDGHAGESETSLLWFAGDRYVDRTLIPKVPNPIDFSKGRTSAGYIDAYDPDLNRKVFPKAYSGNPAAGSKEKGARLNEILAEGLVEVIDALRNGTLM
jgi:creatinine amidohydrolase